MPREGGCTWNAKAGPCFGDGKRKLLINQRRKPDKHLVIVFQKRTVCFCIILISKMEFVLSFVKNLPFTLCFKMEFFLSFVKNLPFTLCFKHLVLFKTSNC